MWVWRERKTATYVAAYEPNRRRDASHRADNQSGFFALARRVFSDHNGVIAAGREGSFLLGLLSVGEIRFQATRTSFTASGSVHTVWELSLKIISLTGKPHLYDMPASRSDFVYGANSFLRNIVAADRSGKIVMFLNLSGKVGWVRSAFRNSSLIGKKWILAMVSLGTWADKWA